jgi:membrane-associated PAP2 superfamily phosphatase
MRERVGERQMGDQGDVGVAEQPGWFWTYALWLVGLGFLLLVGLGTSADLDLRLAGYFYDPTAPQPWFLKDAVPWIWLYRYGESPTWLLAIGAAAVWCGSLRWCAWVCYRRACALLVFAAILGPLLLVNGILKPLWGRPRPRQVELFGGSRPYRPWWQPGHPGDGSNVPSGQAAPQPLWHKIKASYLDGGRSFPSGHAAMGYVLVGGVFLVPRRRPTWLRGLVLGGALAYGSLLGLTRIVQGGHFLSDVLWSGGLMCFTVATLQAVLHPMFPIPIDTRCDLRSPRAVDTRRQL